VCHYRNLEISLGNGGRILRPYFPQAAERIDDDDDINSVGLPDYLMIL
jgi:hypothetical protein